jgi:hypothetical protein
MKYYYYLFQLPCQYSLFLFVFNFAFQALRFRYFGFRAGVFMYTEMTWIRRSFNPKAANLVPSKKFRVRKSTMALPETLSFYTGTLRAAPKLLQQTPEAAVIFR